MFIAIFIAKFLDIIGFLIAGVTVLFIKSKWGIIISGVIASFLTIIVVQYSGRNIPTEMMGVIFFAGLIAHTFHAGIVYYIKQLILKKRMQVKDKS